MRARARVSVSRLHRGSAGGAQRRVIVSHVHGFRAAVWELVVGHLLLAAIILSTTFFLSFWVYGWEFTRVWFSLW